ncbi:MAG TPA: tripartite tricarboxylate transporter substrate binding protein [Burkholderiales bacterium]|nr:tripartite tricarboxylate transporter substrate binding protein [Burkholderiales bacterium]
MRLALVTVAALMTATLAHAQSAYPSRPVRMIIAFSAASETDQLARIVGLKLAELWGQQVVFDNRPGAGGVLASTIVAQAPADGYTLFMQSMAQAIIPWIYGKLPYDADRGFAPVSQVAGVPNVLVVTPAQPVKSVKELIAAAKQKPGQLTYGSAGVGSGMHMTGEHFRLASGIDVIHVPYKGGPEALTDLQGGRIQFVFSPIGLAVPLVKDRRLVALGVTTAQRSPALPNVPTVAEAGVPGFEFDTWYGIFAPGGTPRAVRERVAADVARAIGSADVKEKLAFRGAVAKPSSPDAFERFVRAETQKMGRVVRAAGITPH